MCEYCSSGNMAPPPPWHRFEGKTTIDSGVHRKMPSNNDEMMMPPHPRKNGRNPASGNRHHQQRLLTHVPWKKRSALCERLTAWLETLIANMPSGPAASVMDAWISRLRDGRARYLKACTFTLASREHAMPRVGDATRL